MVRDSVGRETISHLHAIRWVTAGEFASNPQYAHQHYLLRGSVFQDRGNAQRLHEITKARLRAALVRGILRYELDAAVFSETAYQMDAYTVLIPDVSIQIPEREAGDGFFAGSPEVAIEILSPANTRREMNDKAYEYWTHGPARFM